MALRFLSYISMACWAILLGGCAGKAPVQTAASTDPSGVWYLEHYGDESQPVEPVSGTVVSIELDTASGNLSGTAGCNQLTSTVEVDGAKLHVGPIAMTKRMCVEPAGVMGQESAVAQALMAVSRFRLDGDRLHLESDDGHALVFGKAARTSAGSPRSATHVMAGGHPRRGEDVARDRVAYLSGLRSAS